MSKKTLEIKILHLVPSWEVGGAETILNKTVLELDKFKSIKFIQAIGSLIKLGPMADEYFIRNFETITFGGRSSAGSWRWLKLRKYIKLNSFDIIHSHLLKTDLLLFITTLGLKNRPRLISTKHNTGEQIGLVKRIIESVVYSAFDQIIAVSAAVQKNLIRRNILKDKICLVYHSTIQSGDVLQQPKIKANGTGKLVLGTLSRLHPVKGIEILIDSLKLVAEQTKEWHLMIAGEKESPYAARLIEYVNQAGLKDCCSFVGFQTDIYGYLDSIDIFVMPSLSEGLPQSLLQALSRGKPVIASGVGGIPEIVNNSSAILVEPNNADALSEAILKVFDSPKLREELSRAAVKIMNQNFTMDKYIDSIVAIYMSQMSKKRSSND